MKAQTTCTVAFSIDSIRTTHYSISFPYHLLCKGNAGCRVVILQCSPSTFLSLLNFWDSFFKDVPSCDSQQKSPGWGDADSGGDSSSVSDQLVDVLHIRSTGGAFAAALKDGSVITWGNPDYGGGALEQDEMAEFLGFLVGCIVQPFDIYTL